MMRTDLVTVASASTGLSLDPGQLAITAPGGGDDRRYPMPVLGRES